MTWYEAQEDCWAHGGYLAELLSREEELAVNEVFNHDEHFWIGLNDVAQEGNENQKLLRISKNVKTREVHVAGKSPSSGVCKLE